MAHLLAPGRVGSSKFGWQRAKIERWLNVVAHVRQEVWPRLSVKHSYAVTDHPHWRGEPANIITSGCASRHDYSLLPFAPKGSAIRSDEVNKGELAPHACRIQMKAFWLGRLARPDIIKPMNDLATKVQLWTASLAKSLLKQKRICNVTLTMP